MQAEGLRVEVDDRPETLRYKIREAQGQRVPYMVIMGDREAASRTLAPRLRDGTELKDVPLADFIERLKSEARTPSP
jgi:threonyl-tRNA synthetase